MKKPFFKILALLMTLSIIGLIVVQLYWLNQAFKAGANEFNGSIYKALDETVNKINQIELNQYYELFKETKSVVSENESKPQIITSQIENDSASVKYVYLTRYITDKVALPVSGIYTDSLNVTELYASEKAIKVSKDSTVDKFKPLDVNLDREFKDASYTLERFARFDAGNKPIKDRINLKVLDSLFTKNMVKWNCKTYFELAVLDTDTTKILLKDKNFKLSNNNLTTTLFYNKNDEASHYLSVYLPNKKEAIFSKISGLFGVTILFTVIILGIYATSLYAMIRQRKISELKTDFMNNMTHEFKTPLATISVATDALKSPVISKDASKVIHYANLIKQENKRMNNQVEMVLRMSRLERNEMRLNKGVHSVNELVKDSVHSIRLIVENRNGTIFENYTTEDDELTVDSFHIGNIVINILDNANKYSPDKPKIEVETYRNKQWFVIKIVDKGIGMNKSVIERIFDKFYREEMGNIHSVKGHGLGLSYVKHIVDLHNGKIKVESTKGNGSAFYIKLPLK